MPFKYPFNHEIIRNWLFKEIMESGDPYLFIVYLRDALSEIHDEDLVAQELAKWEEETENGMS